MIGASFNTTVDLLPAIFGDATALSGEVAYYPNIPFQVNISDLQGIDALNMGFQDQPGQASLYTGPYAAPGEVIRGYKRTRAMVGQIYTISTLTPSNWFVEKTGGNLLALVTNFGFQYIPDAGNSDMRLAIPMSQASAANVGLAKTVGDPCISSGACIIDPKYADTFSWGYRIMAFQNYNSAFDTAWTLTPRLFWSHDVKGYSAGPIGPGFVEGVKSLTLGIDAEYQETYKIGLSYNMFFGNSYRNANYDKDFLSLTVSYTF